MWAAPGGWHAVRVRRCRARHWTGSFRFWVSGRALSLWGALAPQRAGVSFEADARLQRVGGSIAAGRLAVRWRALQFKAGVASNLIDLVVTPLRSFCSRSVDTT